MSRRILALLLLIPLVLADEHAHTYQVTWRHQPVTTISPTIIQDTEEVLLWMNTVGPYHNRQETYGYFTLPFCLGPKEHIGHYHETMSEALQGTELEYSGLQIEFRAAVPG